MDKQNVDLLLMQWQTCVEMANNLSSRRDNANNIFMALHTAIITAISFVWEIESFLLPICGIALAIIWICYINNFKRLSEEKYNVINSMEKLLPEQPFTKEWRNLKKGKRYINQTTIERVMPIVFMIIYAITIGFIIFINFFNAGGQANV